MSALSNFLRLTQSLWHDNKPHRTDLQNDYAFCKPSTVCTLALFFRMFEDFPLILAANRDEHFDRPTAAPALIANEPKVIAGIDLRAGGTWLGVNERGVAAGILNRRVVGEIPPDSDLRSRGQLCLDLLKCRSVAEAQAYLENHRLRYNPFTAVVADGRHALVAYNSDGRIITEPLAPGLHIFSSAAQFDSRSAKAERAYSLFHRAAQESDLARRDSAGAIAALQPVLGDHSSMPGSNDPADAICVHRESSGTVSSSILRMNRELSRFECSYCDGPPCRNSFGASLTLDIS
jgi:uncharacterized protein with NRDE domain